MAQNHEDMAAELHQEFAERVPGQERDLAGGYIGPADTKEKHMDVTPTDVEMDPTPDGGEPNEQEKASLRRVGENLPAPAYLIAIVELTERFTYYGCQGLFQNYISNRPNGADGAPGLGLGHQGATGLNLFFQWFCYVTPILGAIIADQYLGKYNTILIFAGVYWVGLLILWASALPASIAGGHALGGYIAAIIIIGFGTGGIKSNIAPLIADQYQRRTMAIKTQKSGERTIIDPAITYQRIYMVFYWCINLGSLSLIATPFMEKEKGFGKFQDRYTTGHMRHLLTISQYVSPLLPCEKPPAGALLSCWTAFLMCFCAFNIGVLVLILRRKSYVVRPPQGQVITDAFKAIGIMIKSRNLNAPKPTWRAANGVAKPVPWNDHFIDELQRALKACKVFIFYPIFWVCYGQFSSNFVSQAGQMKGYGMPNDFMQNFDPISILVFTPLLDRVLYPILRRRGIELRPIMRITIGFSFAAICMAYAAIVQHLVYSAGPCYDAPGACPAGMDGETKLPNNVHIAVQTPAYVFIGLSEIFISVTGLEYAYTKAPPSMKSFVQSIYLFTNALGSALNEALIPVLVDPKILWMYAGISIFTACTAVVFWFLFHHYDAQEEKMYDLDRDLPTLVAPGQKTAQQIKEENL